MRVLWIFGAFVAALALWGQAPRAGTSTNIEGLWSGTLPAGTMKLRLVARIKRGPDGSLAGTLDSIDQGALDLPIDTIRVRGIGVHLELKAIGGAYEGTLAPDGQEIKGEWTQGGISLPLTLRRTETAPRLSRPQEPHKPLPYDELEVSYENKAAGVTLGGTLTVPSQGGPFPAVLLITGSGDQDRNETVAGHRPFLVLADALTRRGIAVLRVDDRGVGASGGSSAQATSEELAGDVLAGLEFLKAHARIDPQHMGLIGHSEGGLIAPMVAVRSPDVAFLVSLAGPGVPGERVLYAQGAAIMKASGAPDQLILNNRKLQEQLFNVVKEEPDRKKAEQRIREVWATSMSGMSEELRQAAGASSEAMLQGQLKMLLSPWFRYFLTYDPAPTWKKVKCPVLAANGELDLQVPAGENLAAIASALAFSESHGYTIVKLAGLNHLLQNAKTGLPLEYAQIEETMAPQALTLIGDWVVKVTSRPVSDGKR